MLGQRAGAHTRIRDHDVDTRGVTEKITRSLMKRETITNIDWVNAGSRTELID
jgi:hypothetical protein